LPLEVRDRIRTATGERQDVVLDVTGARAACGHAVDNARHQRLTPIELKPPGAPGMLVSLAMRAVAEGLDELGADTAVEIECLV
jgi:hypothetical protein